MSYKEIISNLQEVLDKIDETALKEDTPEMWHLSLIQSIVDDRTYLVLCEEKDRIIENNAYNTEEILPYIYGDMSRPYMWKDF